NSPEFIIFSDHENLTEAVDLLKAGAFDYLLSPFKKGSLLNKLSLAVKNIDYTKKLKDLTERIVIEQTNMEIKWNTETTNTIPQNEDKKMLASFQKKLVNEFQSNAQSTEKNTILIVEDDQSINLALKKLLQPKFNIITAETGKECKNHLKNEPIDLILLDIYLPDTTGILLIKDIKKYQKNCSIIIITAYQELDIAIQALQLGAHDYLNKPFLEETLNNAISKNLRLQRLKKIIPKLQNWITENVIPNNQKMSLLNECSKTKLTSQEPFKMSDIYSFFPELRNNHLPDNQNIPNEILEEGLLPFVDALKTHKNTPHKT
ncbi:MAG: response regulator, partial [bacterium]